MIAGVGIELVEIAPFQALVEGPGAGADDLVFVSEELEYCCRKRNGGQHLAARYAAKVATLKALKMFPASTDLLAAVEVTRAGTGQPSIRLREPLKTKLGDRPPYRLHLSLSHGGAYAVAMVVAEAAGPQNVKGNGA